ncbi:hypothetical protein GCM10027589_25340 [Actinocorallia lasiicapitis]
MAEDDYVPVPVKDGELPAGNPAGYSSTAIVNLVNGAQPDAPNETKASYFKVAESLGDSQGDLRRNAQVLTEAWQGPSAVLVQKQLGQLYESAGTLISASLQFTQALDGVTAAVTEGKARVPDTPLNPTVAALLPKVAQADTARNRAALADLNADLHTAYLAVPSDLFLNLPPGDTDEARPPFGVPGERKEREVGSGSKGYGEGPGNRAPGDDSPGGDGPNGDGPGGNGPDGGPGSSGPDGSGPNGSGQGPGTSGPGIGPGGVIGPGGSGTGPNGTDLAGALPGPGPGSDPFGLPGGPGNGTLPGPGNGYGPNGSPWGSGFGPGFGPGSNGSGSGRPRSFTFSGEVPPGGLSGFGGTPRVGGAFGVIGAEAAEQRAAAAARGNRPMGMGMPMGGMLGGAGGSGRGGQEHERTTWLSEDEEIWGSDDDVAPPVIG